MRFLNKTVFFWFIILISIAIILVGYGFSRYLRTPSFQGNKPVVVELLPGSTFAQLAAELQRKDVLKHASWLTLYAVLTSQARRVKAGEYRVEPGITPLGLLRLFTEGKVVSYKITFVEGWRFQDMLGELEKQSKLKHQLVGLSVSEIMQSLGYPNEHPEGRFFPDSYRYVAGNNDLEILQRAYQKLQQVLQQEWLQRDPDLPYESPYEALIMASIIEKETGVAQERARIAGVFVRRLQKGMRLQTDPTVIYGLGESYQGNLRRKHLQQSTPYNTYMIKGLPPTPIAMVGREAINAALHPNKDSSLYFVAQGDGTHFFSDTLQQHIKAVQRFQVRQRSDKYRSAPEPVNPE